MDLVDNRLQEILDRRGWSQKYLADLVTKMHPDKVKLHQTDISDICLGKAQRLTLVRAASIAVTVGYSVEHIWPSLFKK